MFKRGDVVLIPFPYTDLLATKTRPAVVVSSDMYHSARSEILLAYVSSRLSNVNPIVDYVLRDWKSAGLQRPSFVRPKIAAIEPNLVVYTIGALSQRDLTGVNKMLRDAMDLARPFPVETLGQIDFTVLPAAVLLSLAEAVTSELSARESNGTLELSLNRLRQMLC